MIIVITGNPVDGFEYYGPFDSPSQAGDWAEDLLQQDWWATIVESPASIIHNNPFNG